MYGFYRQPEYIYIGKRNKYIQRFSHSMWVFYSILFFPLCSLFFFVFCSFQFYCIHPHTPLSRPIYSAFCFFLFFLSGLLMKFPLLFFLFLSFFFLLGYFRKCALLCSMHCYCVQFSRALLLLS